MYLSKKEISTYRTAINAALTQVAKDLNLSALQIGKNIHFSPDTGNFHFKVEGVVSGGLDARGVRYNLIRKQLESLPPLFSEFKYGDETYKIVGATATGRKVIASTPDDKVYTFMLETVKRITQGMQT